MDGKELTCSDETSDQDNKLIFTAHDKSKIFDTSDLKYEQLLQDVHLFCDEGPPHLQQRVDNDNTLQTGKACEVLQHKENMKLLSVVNSVDLCVENILSRDLLHSTAKDLHGVTDKALMMKEVGSEEGSTVAPKNSSESGLLNGSTPKTNPISNMLAANKSPLTVNKMTILPQWEKLNNLKSSDENIGRKVVVANGISFDPVFENRSEVLMLEEENRTASDSLGFGDFVDDNEKFGLSEAEVNRLLQDVPVDDKDSEAASKSKKSKDTPQNGFDQEDNDSRSERLTSGGPPEKTSNFADMILSTFEKNLSGFDLNSVANNSSKNGLPDVLCADDSMEETAINECAETVASENISDERDSKKLEATERCSGDTAAIHENGINTTSNNQANDEEKDSNSSSPNSTIFESERTENETSVCTDFDKTVQKILCTELDTESSDKEKKNETIEEKEGEFHEAEDNMAMDAVDDMAMDAVDDMAKDTVDDMAVDSREASVEPCETSEAVEVQENLSQVNENLNSTEMDSHQETREEVQENLSQMNENLNSTEIDSHQETSETEMETTDDHNKPHIVEDSDSSSAHCLEELNESQSSLNDSKIDESDTRNLNEQCDKIESIETVESTDERNTSSAQIRVKDPSELRTVDKSDKNFEPKSVDNTLESSESKKSVVEPHLHVEDNEAERLIRKRSSSLENQPEIEIKRTRISIQSSDSNPNKDNDTSTGKDECIIVEDNKTGEKLSKTDGETEGSDREPKNTDEEVIVEGGETRKLDEKTGNFSEELDTIEKAGNFSEELDTIDRLSTEQSDLCEGVSDESDRTEEEESNKTCESEKGKHDKELRKECPVSVPSKRAGEHGNIIEVKKVRLSPEMERQLNILNNLEKLKNIVTNNVSKSSGATETESTGNKAKQPDKNLKINIAPSKSKFDECVSGAYITQNKVKECTSAEKSSSVQSLQDDKEDKENEVQPSSPLGPKKCRIPEPEKHTLHESKRSTHPAPEKSVLSESEKFASSDPGKSTPLELEKSIPETEKSVTSDPGKSTQNEPEKSHPPRSPKSNLDLAIERVVLGITDDDFDPAHRKYLPTVRKLYEKLQTKLTRMELEEFIVAKLCEVVGYRSKLGELRQKIQVHEQATETWQKKGQQIQKQNKDMEMVMKRYIGDARTRKERPIPVKITRSVGLQVHMGPIAQNMLRNRQAGSDAVRTPGQVRRRNRVSSPPVTGTMQQQQPASSPQQQQRQTAQTPQSTQTASNRTTPASPQAVQKPVTPTFNKLTPTSSAQQTTVTSRPSVATHVSPQAQVNKLSKIVPSPIKPVGRTIATVSPITTGAVTSINNTVNSSNASTTIGGLRVASAAQLNSRTTTPVKQTSGFGRVIDLTDEEDRTKSNNLRPMNTAQTSLSSNIISTSPVQTGVPVSTASIQQGSIRVVQPHQLTGGTTTTLIAPSSQTAQSSRVAYFVNSPGGQGQQRQVLIASSASQVRPGVMTVSSRQNQLPTLLFKNGTVVPIQQASGTQSMNTATILRPGTTMQAGQLQQVLSTSRPGQQIRVAPGLVTTVGRMTAPTVNTVPILTSKHPAPLPNPPVYQPNNANWKFPPPKPELKISKGASKHQQGIVLSWNMTLTSEYEEIASYQLYAYQEGSAAPNTALWKKVGDVKALPLPMACTLTQFMEGHKYHFAVRAVDVHTRVGPFSLPGNIVLTRKNN